MKPLPLPPTPDEVRAARLVNPPPPPTTLPIQPKCFYTFQYDDVDFSGKPIKMFASDWNNLVAGKTYQIQASTDLNNWVPIGSQLWDDVDPASYLRIVRQVQPAPAKEFIRLALLV